MATRFKAISLFVLIFSVLMVACLAKDQFKLISTELRGDILDYAGPAN